MKSVYPDFEYSRKYNISEHKAYWENNFRYKDPLIHIPVIHIPVVNGGAIAALIAASGILTIPNSNCCWD